MKIIYRPFSPKDVRKLKLFDQETSLGQLANYSKLERNPYNNIGKYFIEKDSRFWIAEDVDYHKIVGGIGLKVISKGVGKMKSLRVHPDYRRKGIATKLISMLEKYCENNNFSKIVLGVGTDEYSLPAVGLYQFHGYKLTHTKTFEDNKSKAHYFEKQL